MKFLRLSLTTALACLAVWAIPAWALDAPTAKVVLTVSGKITEHNLGDKAVFDMAMLEKLPQHSFTTKTPWDKEAVKFTGPLLRDVLAQAKATGATVRAVALNDYKITIPASDAQAFELIMALRINDQPISVRTKGPLFIIYPFDSKPELQSTKYYERSIWQLKAIEVE